MITSETREYIDRSVLCWLATSSVENLPNVSPKEVFVATDDRTVLVANIASPQTVRNIQENPEVCLSFVDIFVQKGFQLKGTAEIVGKKDPGFEAGNALLQKITEGQFPFATFTKITVRESKPIIAPKYKLYPETTENEQIESALKTYGVRRN